MYENHLKLQDIHIGDWVQEYNELTGNFSMPMCVSAIFEDGTVYLDFNGDDLDVWEANIEDIAPIKIDKDILKGFGFRKGVARSEWIYDIGDFQIVFDTNPCVMKFFIRNKDAGVSPSFYSHYIHQLQDVYRRFTQTPLILNWKGI